MTNTYTATVKSPASGNNPAIYNLNVYQSTTDVNGNAVTALISTISTVGQASLTSQIADLQARLVALQAADTAYAAAHPAPTPTPTPTPT